MAQSFGLTHNIKRQPEYNMWTAASQVKVLIHCQFRAYMRVSCLLGCRPTNQSDARSHLPHHLKSILTSASTGLCVFLFTTDLESSAELAIYKTLRSKASMISALTSRITWMWGAYKALSSGPLPFLSSRVAELLLVYAQIFELI